MHPNPSVDFYFTKATAWQAELQSLRTVALATQLTETLKWGCPCYTMDGANIILIHAFKDYCALLFFKGALLADPANFLIRQTENVQAARQIRFTSAQQIADMEATIKSYIDQAVAVEKSGLKVAFKPTEDFPLPVELRNQLDENPDLAAAFHALTPGRQRGYALYFAEAKQSKTREARIQKSIAKILIGKGFDDR